MKKSISGYFKQLAVNELSILTSIVKETIATKVVTEQKTFTAIDLWNIHRNAKLRTTRRYL